MSLTPPTSYINLYLRHLETPLNSDEDSSVCSGDEIDVVSDDWRRVMQVEQQENRLELPLTSTTTDSQGSNRDHCYSSRKVSCTLTPPESSEDEDSYQGFYVSGSGSSSSSSPELFDTSRSRLCGVLKSVDNDRLNPSVRNLFPSSKMTTTSLSSSPSTTATVASFSSSLKTHSCSAHSKPKFTFRVNFKAKSKQRRARDELRTLTTLNRSNLSKSALSSTTSTSGYSDGHLAGGGGGDRPKDARDLHNHMERQRRTELKNAFDLVKKSVPTISSSERVSKQMILDKAIEYCRTMRVKEAAVNKRRRAMHQQNSLLMKKLQSLQNETALTTPPPSASAFRSNSP